MAAGIAASAYGNQRPQSGKIAGWMKRPASSTLEILAATQKNEG